MFSFFFVCVAFWEFCVFLCVFWRSENCRVFFPTPGSVGLISSSLLHNNEKFSDGHGKEKKRNGKTKETGNSQKVTVKKREILRTKKKTGNKSKTQKKEILWRSRRKKKDRDMLRRSRTKKQKKIVWTFLGGCGSGSHAFFYLCFLVSRRHLAVFVRDVLFCLSGSPARPFLNEFFRIILIIIIILPWFSCHSIISIVITIGIFIRELLEVFWVFLAFCVFVVDFLGICFFFVGCLI